MPEVVAMIAKKVIIDLFTDPEKVIKFILVAIIAPILLLLLIFVIPIILVVSLPSVLFDGGGSANDITAQSSYIAIYQQAPDIIKKKNLEWIEQKKRDYAGYDDIVIKSN